jgi:hypothetical protein
LLYRDQILFRSDHVSCLFSLFFIPIAPRIHGSLAHRSLVQTLSAAPLIREQFYRAVHSPVVPEGRRTRHALHAVPSRVQHLCLAKQLPRGSSDSFRLQLALRSISAEEFTVVIAATTGVSYRTSAITSTQPVSATHATSN